MAFGADVPERPWRAHKVAVCPRAGGASADLPLAHRRGSITSEAIGARTARRPGSVDDGDPILYETGDGRACRGANSIMAAAATGEPARPRARRVAPLAEQLDAPLRKKAMGARARRWMRRRANRLHAAMRSKASNSRCIVSLPQQIEPVSRKFAPPS